MNYPAMTAAALVFMLAGEPQNVDGAEIKVLAAGSLKLVLTQLVPDFEKSSRSTVSIDYGPAGALADRARKGETADVVIVTRPQLESLESQGAVLRGSHVDIAAVALGVAVRKGAPKPDIGTVDAFKRALLSARSIGYRDPATGSTSGITVARMIERLGIADELKPRIKLDSSPGDRPEHVFDPVATGEVEMQIGQLTEIAIAPEVDLAGPLPDAVQDVSVQAAGIVAASKVPDAARAFIGFISSPTAAAVLKANGFQAAVNN